MAVRDPYTEPMFIIHQGDWRYVVRESNEADGCCAIHYEEDVVPQHGGPKTVRANEPVTIGEPKAARAVAAAIVAWCDAMEGRDGQ